MISLLRPILLSIALALLAGCTAAPPRPAGKDIAFGLMGDTPYNGSEIIQLDALIERLNGEDLAFVVHVGDITSGAGPCTDEWFLARRQQFNRLRHPFIVIPGDNDWTDCHRSGMDPMERLAKFRELFLAGDTSLGGRPMQVVRQGGPHAEYREHMRWEAGNVLFVTLNVQGSNNNLARTPAMDEEHRQRMAAVLAWMDEAERIVNEKPLAGLVILIQANPDFEDSWHRKTMPGKPDGLAGFRVALLALARRLEKPILFVHGDSHRYQLNQPLRDPATGVVLRNFTRLEVWGAPWVRWVRGALRPGSETPITVTDTPP